MSRFVDPNMGIDSGRRDLIVKEIHAGPSQIVEARAFDIGRLAAARGAEGPKNIRALKF